MEKYYAYGFGLMAIIGYSTLTVLFKKADQALPSFLVIAISMFFLSMIALGFHLTLEERIMPSKNGWLLLLLAGVINAAAFYFMLQAMAQMPVWHYQMIALLFPIISAVVAYYLLGEYFSYKLFIGFAVAALGIYIAVKPSWKPF